MTMMTFLARRIYRKLSIPAARSVLVVLAGGGDY